MNEPLTFGRCEPLFRIAAGGMAEVYAARIRGEAGFEKLVAVKRMLPHLAEDPTFVAMFLDEAKLAANIVSPHVVQTLDLGRASDGSLYLSMELVVGLSLHALYQVALQRRERLPVPIACEMLAQAALGVDDAHEARTPTGQHLAIVHRDVSPQNILVGADGRVRVVDFGVARALLRQSHTQTGQLKGKFGYFSPEQAKARELDRRSDVFSLGIVAWETFALRRLFVAESPLQQLSRVCEMPIPWLPDLRRDVSPELAQVVMRALERDRDARYPTARAFAEALRAACPAPVPSQQVAAFLASVAGPQLDEQRGRLEAALSGQRVEVPVPERTPSAVGMPWAGRTPEAADVERAEQPTLIRTPPTAPPTTAANQAPSSEARPRQGAVMVAVVLMLGGLGLALAKMQASRGDGITAVPLSPGAVPDALPVPVPVAAPPAVLLEAPAPAPASPGPVGRPRTSAPARSGPRLAPTGEGAVAPGPVQAEPPSGPPIRDPAPARAPLPVLAPEPSSPPPRAAVPARVAEPSPVPTRVVPSGPPPSRPAGLAGDDAFDQGI